MTNQVGKSSKILVLNPVNIKVSGFENDSEEIKETDLARFETKRPKMMINVDKIKNEMRIKSNPLKQKTGLIDLNHKKESGKYSIFFNDEYDSPSERKTRRKAMFKKLVRNRTVEMKKLQDLEEWVKENSNGLAKSPPQGMHELVQI